MTAQAHPVAQRRLSGPGEFAWSVATILSKELRGRFRGRRAFVVLTVYLAILALIAYGAYTVEAPSARDAALGASDPDGIAAGASLANASASIGQAIFSMLSVFQLLLVAFIGIERRVRQPMLPLGLFRRPSFTGVQLAAFTMSGSLLAMFLYLTLYLQNYLGYAPLGLGKVDIAGLCDLLESSGNDLMIMAELDPSKGQPHTPLEAARINKETMQKLGYTFRS